MTRTLYICYFGLREPLVESQVLPYLRELHRDSIKTSLLTFEPNLSESWTADEIARTKADLAESGIDWHFLPYHKRPSVAATSYDVLNGVRYIRKLLTRNKFDVLHARVHIPAIIALLARKLTSQTPKIIFDIRGFLPEEYADAGVWKSDGPLFRIAKRIERIIMKNADGFVVLTEAARHALFPESAKSGYENGNRPVEVIPCCVDLEKRFSGDYDSLRRTTRSKFGFDGRKVITHLGALGGLYLTPEIVEFLAVARRRDPTVFALFLTQSDPKDITKRLIEAGYGEGDYFVGRVPHEDVPAYLCASDIGLSFVRSSYATISRSPTKIPEYLACGLPIIANKGVGDVDELIIANRLGSIVEDFDAESYVKALDGLKGLDDVHERAIRIAESEFDLKKVGGSRYRRLYARVTTPRQIRKTLYISYFGIQEPLVQTQVLSYLKEIGKGEYAAANVSEEPVPIKVSLLTFEPDGSLDFEATRSHLNEQGIDWHWLPYHKRVSPIATGWDVVRGTAFIRRFLKRERPDILHGRVHVPTLMGALARKLSRHKPKLVFDIRGFLPEEYTDAGIWPENGLMYRTAKRFERWLLKEADAFIVLTQKARQILFPETVNEVADKTGDVDTNGYYDTRARPIEVIPCCVDLRFFTNVDDNIRESIRRKLGFTHSRVIIYVGSFGGWYLTDEMVDFFSTVREYDPATKVMVLTPRNEEKVIEKLQAKGFNEGDYFVGSAPPADLPGYLCSADVAVAFIMPSYSKKASSPTKHAEYLAAGLPIICNSGIGDTDEQIRSNGVGALIEKFDRENYVRALVEVEKMGDVSERCRETAHRLFDLEEVGGESYRRLYSRLLDERRTDLTRK